MTTPTGTSAADPMTPEQVAEARAFVERWINVDTSEYPSPPAAQYRMIARAYRELERHAEAMAAAFQFYGGGHPTLTSYRDIFPKPQEPRT